MKRILFILILLLAYTIPAHAQKIPKSQYTVLEYGTKDALFAGRFPQGATATTLSDEEIACIEQILQAGVIEENKRELTRFNELKRKMSDLKVDTIVFKKYKRQYIAAITSGGEKIIWVNCLCSDFKNDNWRKHIVKVRDGGNCFFNVMISLSKKTYYDLRINGWA